MKQKIILILLTINSIFIYSQSKILNSMVNSIDKAIFTYNSSGQYISHQLFMKNNDGVNWDLDQGYTVTYNADNKVEEEISQVWNGTEFINAEKFVHLYDGNLNIIKTTLFNWNSTANGWETFREMFYTYNASNDIIQGIGQGIGGNEKDEYIYNGVGQLIRINSFTWDSDNNMWHTQAYHKSDLVYDNGNLINRTESWFNENTNQWIADTRAEFSYNNSYAQNTLIIPTFYEFNDFFFFNHMITSTEYFSWNTTSSSWVNESVINFSYSNSTISVSENELNLHEIYPNPFVDYIKIDNLNNEPFEITFFDTKGVLIKKENNNSIINLSDLESGIYIYKIIKDNLLQTGKLIKK